VVTSALLVLAFLLAGCGGERVQRPVVRGILGFDRTVAPLQNEPLIQADPGIACGSRSAEFGAELTELDDPRQAKVLKNWGEIVPGKLMYFEGTATNGYFAEADFMPAHPFNVDMLTDIKPDPAYSRMVQVAGTGSAGDETPPTGTLHWELSRGLAPHQTDTTIHPGFVPQAGDRVITWGRWIVDCQHADYHTEIHPPVFVSFAREQGSTAQSNAFYVPYWETQLYTPDASRVADFDDAQRLVDPTTLPLPQYLFNQLLRIVGVGDPGPLGFLEHLESHHVLEANRHSPVTWYACAPGPRRSGEDLSVSYRFTTRPGVSILATEDEDIGCVRFTATIGRSYQPLEPTRKDCELSWELLAEQTREALQNPMVNIRDLISEKVPESARAKVLRDPVIDCYDPFVVPDTAPTEGEQRIVMSANQPFPFYGTVEVRWRVPID